MLFLAIGSSSCVELKCYSNQDYAIEGAKEFCNQAHDKKELCESLKIYGKNICIYEKYTKDACRPLGDTVQTFARILYPDCQNLDEKICRTRKSCKWTFSDPLLGTFGDFE